MFTNQVKYGNPLIFSLQNFESSLANYREKLLILLYESLVILDTYETTKMEKYYV